MTDQPSITGPSARLLSLDALRGLTIALMIVVNTPGSWSTVYAPLLHAEWHGFTPTDLVFPSFLCVVGVSIALAYGKHRATAPERAAARRKILVRALKIFVLGLFLNLWPEFAWDEMRFAGVLQRIALVFAAVALLFLGLRGRALAAVTACILLGYWALLGWAPVPRDAVIDRALLTGVVERAHGQTVAVAISARSDTMITANLEPATNLAAWVDRQWLPGAMYEKTWDPEGWLSTVPSIATCLIGLLAGIALTRGQEAGARARLLLGWGALALVLGYAWAQAFPLNKNLWTSSFALVTAGWTLVAFAIAVWLIDGRGWRKPAFPFLVFGSNPIAAYVLAAVLTAVFHRSWFGRSSIVEQAMEGLQAGGASPRLASLACALGYAFIVFVPIWWMHRRRIFLRL